MIKKKLGKITFAWNPQALNGRGYWYVAGKDDTYARAASKMEASRLGAPKGAEMPPKGVSKENQPKESQASKEKESASSSKKGSKFYFTTSRSGKPIRKRFKSAGFGQDAEGPSEYEMADITRSKGLMQIASERMMSGEGIGKSLKGAISDKMKARATNLKKMTDPLNLLNKLPGIGKFAATAYGKKRGRSAADISYFTGIQAPTEMQEKQEEPMDDSSSGEPEVTATREKKEKSTNLAPIMNKMLTQLVGINKKISLLIPKSGNPEPKTAKGKTTSKVGGAKKTDGNVAKSLDSLYNLFYERFEEEKKEKEIQDSFEEEKKQEEERRHKELIDAILKGMKPKEKKEKEKKEEGSLFGDLLSGFMGRFGNILKSFGSIFSKITGVASSFGKKILGAGKSIIGKTWDATKNVGSKIKDGFQAAKSKLGFGKDAAKTIPKVEKGAEAAAKAGKTATDTAKAAKTATETTKAAKSATTTTKAAKAATATKTAGTAAKTTKAAGTASKAAAAAGKTAKAAGTASKTVGAAAKGGKVASTASKATKLLKGGGKLLGFLKGIPGLGLIAAGADLVFRIQDINARYEAGEIKESAYKKEIAKAIGGAAMAGALPVLGAAVGSVIPGVGTVVGGLAGVGATLFGGDKLGEWLGEKMYDFFVDDKKTASGAPTEVKKATASPAGGAAPKAAVGSVSANPSAGATSAGGGATSAGGAKVSTPPTAAAQPVTSGKPAELGQRANAATMENKNLTSEASKSAAPVVVNKTTNVVNNGGGSGGSMATSAVVRNDEAVLTRLQMQGARPV